jgi:hypothetical protein
MGNRCQKCSGSQLIPLPSLSDKLTIWRGYSQRKIKVLPLQDGRGYGSLGFYCCWFELQDWCGMQLDSS